MSHKPRKCFVLMPFKEPFNTYYREVISPAIKEAGFEPVRGDEIYGTGVVIEDIKQAIKDADALLADVTEKNPNVSYELGIAHTYVRPVVIISQSRDDIPFDYGHLRSYRYNPIDLRWEERLKEYIVRTLQTITANQTTPPDIFELQPDNSLATTGFLRELGITKIYPHRRKIDFPKLIRTAEACSDIKFLGIGLKFLLEDEVRSAIRSRLRDNCKVKLLLLDPTSEFCTRRAGEVRKVYKNIRKDLDSLNKGHREFIDVLPESLRPRITLCHYDWAPTFCIFIAGKTMIVGFYLRNYRGADAPHLRLELNTNMSEDDVESGRNYLYNTFLEHFDALWGSSCGAA
jgi:hypothetical protein